MKKFKNSNGVSMIILMVTVIVMLILAGVTIQMSVEKDDGILDVSKKTTQKVKTSEIKSAIEPFILQYFDSSEYAKKQDKEYTSTSGNKIIFFFAADDQLKVQYIYNDKTKEFTVNEDTGKLE